jgi:integrase
MRGSVYYQTATLTKYIFHEGAKKTEKIDSGNEHYQKVSSYKTMESYRNIWNNFFNYLKEHWSFKNCELIEAHHVSAYMEYKLEYYPSTQYMQKISAAIGKLEIALQYFSQEIYGQSKEYNFSIRQDILDSARDLNQVANNYHNRTYKNPKKVISCLVDEKHTLAASIQLEGGARIEGVAFIKKEQLHGYVVDEITNNKKGIIFTKEKGGKEGDVLVPLKVYEKLKKYIEEYGFFKIKRQQYYEDIKQACRLTNENPEGSHGFRWNFAKNRMFEYAQANYSYEDSLLGVSREMKHNRSQITEHYLGF